MNGRADDRHYHTETTATERNGSLNDISGVVNVIHNACNNHYYQIDRQQL